MPDYTRFKGVTNIGDAQLMNQLQSNLVEFCNWSMLCIGAFYSVYLTSRPSYGGVPANLRLSDDRRYPKGLMWEGYRGNWVWEQNVEYSSQPIIISGIYVNNTFYPTGSTDPIYAYNINYPLGRVVFNNPIPTNSLVQVEYSYRQWGFYPANVDWFRDFLTRMSRIDDYQFNWFGSGIWSTFADNRVSFPTVIIEPVPIRKFVPKGLGAGQWVYQDVNFHIYAETAPDRDTMIDILTFQNEKRFFMYDQNQLAASSAFPLNQYGYLVNPGYNYPYLVNNYLWTGAIFWDITADPIQNDPPALYVGNVKANMEIDLSYTNI